MVEVEGGDAALGRDLAMHVTASAPLVVTSDQLDGEFVENERKILVAQAASTAKTPEIAEKMVTGRLRKTLGELSLVEQPFVRDSKTKVGKLLADADARCVRIVRFEVGAVARTEHRESRCRNPTRRQSCAGLVTTGR